MKKKMLSLVLLVGLLVSGTMTAYADNTDASSNDVPRGDWNVTFTQNGEMAGNLNVDEINDRMAAMEPGDEIEVSVVLTNTNSSTTYWHMKNNVKRSMEKDQAESSADPASGGGYTYRLVYEDAAGEIVLYSNERVGGEEEDGLLELQSDERLKEYFYLGTLASGQSGRVRLTVGLDGETQGNSYQDRVANLLMQFAVELAPQTPGGGGKTHHRTITREVVNNEVVYLDEDGVPLADPGMEIVKTGDEMKLYPYILTACISGSLLLAFAFFGLVGRKKEEEGGAVR